MDVAFRGRAVALACSFFLAALVSCGGDPGTEPETLGAIKVESGDAQQGLDGAPLRQDIEIGLFKRGGAPAVGVRVQWDPRDGGVADPAETVTDAFGRASTRWTLGGSPDHTLAAIANGYATQYIRASGTAQLFPLDSVRRLEFATYDGSGQTVHPDFLERPATGTRSPEYLALTPYPGGNPAFENPVLYGSTDRLRWTVPVPSLNPIVSPASGYFSDPDVVWDPVASEIRLYYRQVDRENEIFLMRSTDASVWTAPQRVAHAPNNGIVSPSIVRRSATDWLMWSVNGGAGCVGNATFVQLRHSADGIVWSAPDSVLLDQPGFTPWHIDVHWIESRQEYWALYNVKTPESCSTPAVYFATSKDGVEWTTYPSPLLARGSAAPFRDIVYRATMSVDERAEIVTFWYSGATYDNTRGYVWSTATERKKLSSVFDKIGRVSGGPVAELRKGVPGLVDPP